MSGWSGHGNSISVIVGLVDRGGTVICSVGNMCTLGMAIVVWVGTGAGFP